jgi:CheY-like chemotaxis protein
VVKLGAIVVSHHQRFRQDLAQFVELVDPCIEVIGTVSNACETLSQIEVLRPGLALLDLDLGHINTFELIRCIHAAAPTISVVVIGNELAIDYRHLALAAGAIEYVDVLEIGTQLPAALQLAEHPAGCGSTGSDSIQPRVHESPSVVDQIATFFARFHVAPTGPKYGPCTAWQYVHIGLALMILTIIFAPHQNADSGVQRALILMLALAGIAIMEARQFARARQRTNSGWRTTS